MSNPPNDSSQLNDEQIEDLVREFSQFETNSQTFYESQTQTFYDEQMQMQQQQSPNASNVPLDFQAEFLKCMFNAGEIEGLAAKARANTNAGQQLDYDSQSDVETVVQTYMTGNPDWNENVPLKPLDIEAFLETRDFFVTIKSGATNTTAGKQSESSSAAADRNKNKRDNRFTLGPLPLEIEDIHRVTIDVSEVQRWNSYQKIYGQKFKTVMFYGRCKPCGSSAAQKNRNVKLYEVDDGSDMVIVHFPHFDAEYSVLSRGIERLTEEYALAKREGISYLGADCHPNKPKCKEMLQNVNIILNIIRRMGAIKQEFFTHGCKVSVVGRVFSHSDGTNHVFAYHMIEDDCKERDFEIKFKNHLISVYESKYLKYKVDGSKCTNDEQTEATRTV